MFLILYTALFIAFYSNIKKCFYKIRRCAGLRKTSKKILDLEFKDKGGIVGYQPITERHIALIFISDSSKNYGDISYKEIEPLIEHYDKYKENYKLYFCYLAEDFLKIVKSKYVYGIHILGHGAIDSLGFEDGVLIYRELRHTEPKEFIAQWHCNHGEGDSLGVLIGRKYYVPYGYTLINGNKGRITKLINGKIKWTENPKFIKTK